MLNYGYIIEKNAQFGRELSEQNSANLVENCKFNNELGNYGKTFHKQCTAGV